MTPYQYGKWTRYWVRFPSYQEIKTLNGEIFQMDKICSPNWLAGHQVPKGAVTYCWHEDGKEIKRVRTDFEILPADKPRSETLK